MGYVLMCLAICNVVLVQMGSSGAFWLLITTTATAAIILSRSARAGALGRELGARWEAMPLWQIFGLAIVVFTGEVIWASYLPTPEQSAIVRKVMGSATFCLIFIGIEMAVFRKIEARKSSSQ